MKIKNYLLLLFVAVFVSFGAYAQDPAIVEEEVEEELENVVQGDTVAVYSDKMQKSIKNTIVVPAQYFDPDLLEEQYPVIYLLHGYSGDYSNWAHFKDLDAIATDLGVIFVCPDGEHGWYWDSPVRKDSQYETYVSKELVNYIDTHYRTMKTPAMRAITGLSMGGHGALWLAIRHSDVFGNAGSMSGGVNIIPFPKKWKMAENLGSYEENKERWEKHTVINLVPTLKNHQLNIIFDCGSSDFFAKVNNDLHEALLKAGIDHDYISRPGTHNWKYWTNSLDFQLLFFQKAFEKATDAMNAAAETNE